MAPAGLDDIELFISHASEDKEGLVRPLAHYLRRAKVRVWYDEFELTAGDSLSRSIDKGLAIARYGLVVISPHFVVKRWPEYELRGLTAKEMAGSNKVIIPLLHDMSSEDLLGYSPTLADKIAISTAGKSVPEVAESILKAIRPELADRLSMLRTLLHGSEDDEREVVQARLGDLRPLRPVPERLQVEGHLVIRVKNVVNTMGAAAPGVVGDLTTFLINLHQDFDPEPELRIWEVMQSVYLETCAHFELAAREKETLVRFLVACSLGSTPWMESEAENLPNAAASHATRCWDRYLRIASTENIVLTP